MKRFVWPAETKTLSHANDDGPWEASFPEEGDKIDQRCSSVMATRQTGRSSR